SGLRRMFEKPFNPRPERWNSPQKTLDLKIGKATPPRGGHANQSVAMSRRSLTTVPSGTSDSVPVGSVDDRIFSTSLDLILLVDRKGTFLRVSPSSLAILGYRPEEMIGRSAAEFLHPDDLEDTRSEMRQARRGQHMRNFQCRYVHRDGNAVELAWTGLW